MLNREKLNAAMAINYLAPVEIAKLVSSRGNHDPAGSSFVFISSIAAHHAQAGLLAYSASKSALGRAAAGLARELAPKAIRVNSIVPGWVETAGAEKAQASMSEEQRRLHTAQYPLGLGKPEDVAAASLFLLSGMSSWITGIELFVDGGFSA
jgi:NAD(P)-dependent dehydrogenase (short-subunit alcohol dehydrogenase family)